MFVDYTQEVAFDARDVLVELSKGFILSSLWALIAFPVFVVEYAGLVPESQDVKFGSLGHLRLNKEPLLCEACAEVRTCLNLRLFRYGDVMLFAKLLDVFSLAKSALESLAVTLSVY